MAVLQGTAVFAPTVSFKSNTASTFLLLQQLLDAIEEDPTARNSALSYLVAYHAAALSADKYSAIKNLNKIHGDAKLLLDYMWNFYGSSYSNGMIPVSSPTPAALSEIVSTVAATRTTKTLSPLPGPKH
jgi:hypothetical protein